MANTAFFYRLFAIMIFCIVAFSAQDIIAQDLEYNEIRDPSLKNAM